MRNNLVPEVITQYYLIDKETRAIIFGPHTRTNEIRSKVGQHNRVWDRGGRYREYSPRYSSDNTELIKCEYTLQQTSSFSVEGENGTERSSEDSKE